MWIIKKMYLVAGVFLIGSLANAQETAIQQQDAELPSFDYEQVGAEGAIQALQAVDDQAMATEELGEIYHKTGDPNLAKELKRLIVESSDPNVRSEALNALRTGDSAQIEPQGKASPDASARAADIAGPAAAPSDVDAVSVECLGRCSDVTLGELCDHTDTPTPIAVDCRDVDDDPRDMRCTLDDDPFCSVHTFNRSTSLGNLCDDSSGWDATVYCAR